MGVLAGSERGLVVVERRIEELPAGVDWATHLAFRDDNVGGMTRTDERIPEPDRPVLLALTRQNVPTFDRIATQQKLNDFAVELTRHDAKLESMASSGTTVGMLTNLLSPYTRCS